MKKTFILWLCKVFKVELVEPMQVINQVKMVHEKVPYTLIQDKAELHFNPFSGTDNSEMINVTKRDMLYRCIESMQKEDVITWKQWINPIDGTTNIVCCFYAAPLKTI